MSMSRIRSKLKKRYLAFKAHPLTRHRPVVAMLRYMRFNISQSLFPGPRKFKWINDLSFYAQKGDAGIVPNIYYRLFDYEDSMFILNSLNPNDMFVDVGANVGHYTLLAASKGANVIAIEPIPATFDKLGRNVELNNLSDRVNCLMLGIGKEPGELEFISDRDVMNRVAGPSDSGGIKVPVESLNTLLKDATPKMIKIDVEGFELEVLNGAKDVLKSLDLKYLLIELNNSSSQYGSSDEQVYGLIRQSGFYPAKYQVDSDELIRLDSYRTDKFNTLFVRENNK